jgi:acyl-CoA synthetase (AMP-forming)/AMP-acid ligase II
MAMSEPGQPAVWTMDHSQLRTLWAILDHHARHSPDRVAMEYDGRLTSYARMAARAEAMDAALRATGAGPQARIAYLGKNCDLYFTLLAATCRAGMVLAPLNWRLAPDEWEFILRDAGVCLLVHDDWLAAEAAEQARRIDGLSLARIEDFGAAQAAPVEPARDDPHAVAMQMYTSGTTGRPKGAMLSSWNILAQRKPGYDLREEWYQTEEDATLVLSPVAHIAGTGFGVWNLYAGGRIVITREFNPAETISLINRTGVTYALFVPSMLQMLLDHLDASGESVSRLRYIAYGASPMPEAILARAQATLPARFVQMYGMTETGGVATALTPEHHLGEDRPKLRSAGVPFAGGEVAIVDAAGKFLPPDEEGEVVVRSEQVMQGYWNRPEATAEVMLPGGWFRTGDMGRMDEDGFLYVFDRVKDMIITGGENVYPAEVENLLFTHPAIKSAGVIGRPHEKWVEEIVAVVVLEQGASLTLEELREWARGRIAGFKIPRVLQLVDALPMNASGKVLRRELRAANLAAAS